MAESLRRVLSVLVAAVLLSLTAPAAHASSQQPSLADGFGLTQVTSAVSSAPTNTDTST
ncbi:hypothetical protein ACIQPT_20535 [Streptomyces sp. NPDC091289]|uniref:hypothetical protein n=1 Tax=Streptomyces sp. NPDC091289 TaxID=3365989 RepID=UPI0038104B5C